MLKLTSNMFPFYFLAAYTIRSEASITYFSRVKTCVQNLFISVNVQEVCDIAKYSEKTYYRKLFCYIGTKANFQKTD